MIFCYKKKCFILPKSILAKTSICPRDLIQFSFKVYLNVSLQYCSLVLLFCRAHSSVALIARKTQRPTVSKQISCMHYPILYFYLTFLRILYTFVGGLNYFTHTLVLCILTLFITINTWFLSCVETNEKQKRSVSIGTLSRVKLTAVPWSSSKTDSTIG